MSKNNYEEKKNGKRGGKGKRPFRKDDYKRSDDRTDNKYDKNGTKKYGNYDSLTSNDISYYNKTPLYPRASSIAWNKIIGRPFAVEMVHTAGDGLMHRESLSYPTLTRIDFEASIGWAQDGQDAVNVAFQNLMAQMYSKLSSASSLPFQRADLCMMQTSMATIMNWIGYCKRALSCRNIWAAENITYPKAVIDIMGLDVEDLIEHYPLYANRLDYIIAQFNAMEILSTIDVYKRQYALSHTLYVDEDSILSQLYIFVPRNIYKYVYPEEGVPYCQDIIVDTHPGGHRKLSEILDIVQESITSWRDSDDYYSMTGTMKRSFPGLSVIRLDPVTSEAPTIMFDERISQQVMNLTIYPELRETNITQDPATGNVIFKPTIKINSPSGRALYSPILKIFKGDVTIEDNMEMTRLTNLVSESKHEFTGDHYLAWCGPEIVTNYYIGRLSGTDTFDYMDLSGYGNVVYVDATDTGPNSAISVDRTDMRKLAALFTLANFRFVPNFYVSIFSWNGSEHEAILQPTTTGDIYNYTTLPYDQWSNMQKAALLSLYTLPDLK